MFKSERRVEECETCHAGAAEGNVQLLGLHTEGYIREIWHDPDCVEYATLRFEAEHGAEESARERARAIETVPRLQALLDDMTIRCRDDHDMMTLVVAIRELLDVLGDAVTTSPLAGGAAYAVEILAKHMIPEQT